jgi:hypothetical protein
MRDMQFTFATAEDAHAAKLRLQNTDLQFVYITISPNTEEMCAAGTCEVCDALRAMQ